MHVELVPPPYESRSSAGYSCLQAILGATREILFLLSFVLHVTLYESQSLSLCDLGTTI